MKTKDLQKQILEKVQNQFSKKKEMIQRLSELLSVSADGIYRRLRGDTLLTPDEIAFLVTKFQLSLDTLLYGQSDSLLFSYYMLSQPTTSLRTYLDRVYQNLYEVSQIDGVQVYYASQEVPIFQYFSHPDLLRFKMYVYGLTSWNLEFLKDRKYHKRLVDPEVVELGTECVRLYNRFSSKDLWSLNIVDNTLNQIEFLATVELFENPDDAILLCDEMTALLNRAQKMAANGRKSLNSAEPNDNDGIFDLYYNEMISTNNTILVCTPLGKMVFTTFNNPNFLKSKDQRFCDLTENWFQMIINRSTSISIHSAKSRGWFFNRLKEKVLATRRKIKALQL